jgi:membrane protein DedA with SNARE-associated domain
VVNEDESQALVKEIGSLSRLVVEKDAEARNAIAEERGTKVVLLARMVAAVRSRSPSSIAWSS